MQQSLVFLNASAMAQPEAYIGGADKLFDDNGKLVSDGTRKFRPSFMQAYATWVVADTKSHQGKTYEKYRFYCLSWPRPYAAPSHRGGCEIPQESRERGTFMAVELGAAVVLALSYWSTRVFRDDAHLDPAQSVEQAAFEHNGPPVVQQDFQRLPHGNPTDD